jgi:hypothetical protein
MADIDSNGKPLGFNVVKPGFRVFDDGSVATCGPDLGRPFLSNLKDAAAWVNAAVNGPTQSFLACTMQAVPKRGASVFSAAMNYAGLGRKRMPSVAG